ncbi:MAG: carbohydrate-binding module family 20 domain-containing protein, partial [Candidatus Limnocylindria bacterium]
LEEAAITVLNLSETDATVHIPVADWTPDGVELADALGGAGATAEDGEIVVMLPALSAAVLLTESGQDLAPPDAPSAVVAEAATGRVTLSWGAVAGAARYTVWRSMVSGGGYVSVGTTEGETAFADESARNGVRYQYVVTSADAAGNIGPRSAEAVALPQVVLADARLDAPDAVTQPLSAVEPGVLIGALVRAAGEGGEGPTVGISAELGVGPGDAEDPLTDPSWVWSPMRFEADAGGADRFVGEVRPTEASSYRVALRVSTDGGLSWQLADLGGIGYDPDRAVALEAVPASDREAPDTPADAVASVVSESSVTLLWDAVGGDDLFGYEVLRGEAAGGPYQRIGTAVETTFTDDDVAGGRSYVYVVVAVDTSFNRSEPSNAVTTAAEAREVAVTFTVTVPAYTPAGDTIHLAGDFQGWDPAATPMTRVDEVTWTITVPFNEGAAVQYKYTRGSWEAVEKDDGCGEIPNRELAVVFGADGSLVATDRVAKWRDLDNCP